MWKKAAELLKTRKVQVALVFAAFPFVVWFLPKVYVIIALAASVALNALLLRKRSAS
jgi:hypothetical protein